MNDVLDSLLNKLNLCANGGFTATNPVILSITGDYH